MVFLTFVAISAISQILDVVKGKLFLTQKVLDNYPFTLDNLRHLSGKINPFFYGSGGGNGSPYQDIICLYVLNIL